MDGSTAASGIRAAVAAGSALSEAADKIDHDARLAVIIIMRRARPRLTWRQIGRRLGISRMTAHRIAKSAGVA